MPIGDSYSAVRSNRAVSLLIRIFGTTDLHTHIRLRPIASFLKKYVCENKNKLIEVLEPGCGDGVNGFELAKISEKYGRTVRYAGIDKDESSIKIADSLCRLIGKDKMLSFYYDDAVGYLKRGEDLQADIILLADIVEHIKNAEELIATAYRHLKAGGIFVVSAPTPLYPQIFGKKFHNKIGNIVDGYTLEALDKLFIDELECQRISYGYNTGLISSIACWLYYNILDFDNRYLYYIKFILLYPFAFMDFYNSPRVSCTLFAVYKKDPDEK